MCTFQVQRLFAKDCWYIKNHKPCPTCPLCFDLTRNASSFRIHFKPGWWDLFVMYRDAEGRGVLFCLGELIVIRYFCKYGTSNLGENLSFAVSATPKGNTINQTKEHTSAAREWSPSSLIVVRLRYSFIYVICGARNYYYTMFIWVGT